MKNKFSKIFSIAVYTSFALSVGACKSDPVRLPELSGHRGADCIAPENTLASADSCIKYKIDFMECDVCISKDSVFYLLHDSTLDRTTNGTGPIAGWLSADIDTLDAGSWFGEEFKGQRVPRLEVLLRKAKQNGLKLTLDYRSGDFGQLLGLVRREGMLENCTFTFWSDKQAKAFREAAPEVRTLQAYVGGGAELDKVMAEINPNIAVIRIDSLDEHLVERCHKKGLRVLALALGTDNVEESDRKAIELGVDVLATDRPELFVKKYRPEHTWKE
ncbi:glycerophosphodiester phosphodiesterase family protein [Bacteroides fragilis]|uniref:glycerophosphodiester phosphodiesterase family protein n=1 Tax=Bacteroides fragilis TaxID=817 RepID=UPI001C385D51|nr:glycerophosphodiester phosphodiesterase family protein [Bacteroides fragilis]MCM0272157.1 glycerophosphodiester phosphodiesterase family protein [Bacteroides fragilis]